jgi:hypothetical protein
MVEHACNASTWETEVGGWPVLAQPGLHNETLSQRKKKKSQVIFWFFWGGGGGEVSWIKPGPISC